MGGATQTQRGGVRGVRLTGDFKLVIPGRTLTWKNGRRWMDVLFTDGGEPAGANSKYVNIRHGCCCHS